MTDKERLKQKLNPHLGGCETCTKIGVNGTYCNYYGSAIHVGVFSPAKRARKYGVMCKNYVENR